MAFFFLKKSFKIYYSLTWIFWIEYFYLYLFIKINVLFLLKFLILHIISTDLKVVSKKVKEFREAKYLLFNLIEMGSQWSTCRLSVMHKIDG